MIGRAGTFGAALAALTLAVAWTAPASGSSWKVTELDDDQVDGPLFAISCPAADLCVVGGSDSLIATSTDPTGGRSAWRVFHPGGSEDIPPGAGGGSVVFPGAQVRGISCPSRRLCVGASFDGRVLSSTDPTGGAGAWEVTPLSGPKEPNVHMTGVSCPTPVLCVAVAYGSKVVHSTDPTGGAAAWATVELGTPLDLRGVSCPTVSLCAAVDNEGGVVATTDPTGPASAWTLAGRPGGGGSLNGISCPTPALCVTGNAGAMITSSKPTVASSWRAVVAGTGLPLKGVSCPSPTACAAVDNNSDVLVSTDPTGGAAAWSFTNVIPAPSTPHGDQNAMFGISCPTTSFCAAAGAREQVITSTDPFAVDPVQSTAGRAGRFRALITRHPAKRLNPRRRGVRVAFRFRAVGGKARRFKCRLSGRARRLGGRRGARAQGGGQPARRRRAANRRHRPRFKACRSPVRYRVGKGKHAFRVRAIAPGGRRSRPATFHFRVGRLTERQPVGSCPKHPKGLPPGVTVEPCVNARGTASRHLAP